MGILGPLEIDGLASMRPRTRAVLTALAVSRREPLAADQLAEVVWRDDPPVSWNKQVQICIWDVRKALGPDAVETVAGGYRLDESTVDLDSVEFERLIERGHSFTSTGASDQAAAAYQGALALWRGDPFPDAEAWMPARHESARLEELRRAAQEGLVEARLASGDHREVVARAEAMANDEPLRERRWALLALAQYRCGNQAEALRSLQKARHVLIDQLGIDPGPELVALEAAMLRQDPDLMSPSAAQTSAECPYRGLAAYDTEDADLFFGREADATACLERLERVRMLVVTGPSGCGKSSLVRAGVVPVLRRRGLDVVVTVPGADPEASVSAALATSAGHPVLFVDQFEEVFAGHRDDQEVEALCRRLAEYAEQRAPVIVTVRADHLGALAAQPALSRLVERGLYVLSPLTGASLRIAMEAPAAAAGLRLEPGLVDLIEAEVDGEPGALPLLSHALAETWSRRVGRVLTVEGYRQSGGIRGAVARSAEQLYASLDDGQQAKLRRLLLRLVSPAHDGEPVRAHLDATRLDNDEERRRVLDLLIRARLVTRDDESVQLAHEAVARAWPRLRDWLEEDATGQRVMHHLTVTAEGWDALGRPTSELYRGGRLETALEYCERSQPELTSVESEFLEESAREAVSERRALASRNRRLRGMLTAVAVLLVLAVLGGVLAFAQSGRAADERRQSQITTLVATADGVRGTQRDLAALLALEAYELRPDAAAESALFGTFTGDPGIERIQRTGVPVTVIGGSAVWLTEPDRVAFADVFGAAQLVDVETGDRETLAALSDVEGYTLVGGIPGGRHLAVAWRPSSEPEMGIVTVWDLESEQMRFEPIETDFRIGHLAVSPDGATLVVSGGEEGQVVLIDAATGEVRHELPTFPPPADAHNRVLTAAIDFAPDGRLAVGSQAGTVRIIDPVSGVELTRFDVGADRAGSFIRFIDGGESLLAAGAKGLMRVDPETGESQWNEVQTVSACNAIAVLELRQELLCGEWSGRVVAHDLITGSQVGRRFDSQLGNVCAFAVRPDGSRLAELAECNGGGLTILQWRLDGGGAASRLVWGDGGEHWVEQFGYGGRPHLVTGFVDAEGFGGTAVIDDETGELVDRFDHTYAMIPTTDPRRAVVFFGPPDEPLTIGLFDTSSGRRTGPFVDPGIAVWYAVVEGDRAFMISDWPGQLRTFDLASGELVEPSIDLPEKEGFNGVSGTGDGDLLVVYMDSSTSADVATIRRLDGRTGETEATSPEGFATVGVGGGRVIAATRNGRVAELDPVTLEPVGADFPGAIGAIRLIDVDAAGERVALLGDDQRVRVYDIASRRALGDPIDLGTSNGGVALRDDGQLLALSTDDGFVTWNLDAGSWVEAACAVAGRNLTDQEWTDHLSELGDYGQTCPDPESSSVS